MRVAMALMCSLLLGCEVVPGELTLTVRNRASRDLAGVYLPGSGDTSWGDNHLERRLRPGSDLVIAGIGCGLYDLILVDEYAIACELPKMVLCVFDSDVLYREATPKDRGVTALDLGGGVRCPPGTRVEVTEHDGDPRDHDDGDDVVIGS